MSVDLKEAGLAHAIEDYERDGATVLRNVIDPSWISRLAAATDEILSSNKHGFDQVGPEHGRFFGDVFSTFYHPVFRAFIEKAGLAEIAGRLMQSSEVRFFYDQLLVKEPGTPARTSWHQDLPYWPVRGEQVISFWVPIDAASPENGVVTYVRGSHRWNRFFPMQKFIDVDSQVPFKPDEEMTDENPIYDRAEQGNVFGTLGDVRDHPEKYEFITWAVEPGDVIIHHPLVVHGAPGNLTTSNRRRALSTRWLGDDARWDDARPHFMQRLKKHPAFPYPALAQGAKMADPLFPRLWVDLSRGGSGALDHLIGGFETFDFTAAMEEMHGPRRTA